MVGKMLSSSVSKAVLLLELQMVLGAGPAAASTLQVLTLHSVNIAAALQQSLAVVCALLPRVI